MATSNKESGCLLATLRKLLGLTNNYICKFGCQLLTSLDRVMVFPSLFWRHGWWGSVYHNFFFLIIWLHRWNWLWWCDRAGSVIHPTHSCIVMCMCVHASCVHACTGVYVCTHAYVGVGLCMCVHACVCVCAHACVFVLHNHLPTSTHTYMYVSATAFTLSQL